MLSIYNTQSRSKEEFKPLVPGQVKMYCCGPTVYDLLHVGNFRGAIFYNFVRNWLEQSGYQVQFVYNYTDVDDKIINKSLQEKTSAAAVAEKYIAEFEADFRQLQLRPHSLNPRVSASMPQILQMISDLIQEKHAYVSPSGDVWYAIKSFADYGKLSHRKPEDLLNNVRIEKEEQKNDPLDFALWKRAKPGEPSWESPWGAGRPGWHIECSAMIHQHLGEQIDIHGGGLDLLFPHHENEIAQSEGHTHKALAKYWLHNNLINFSGNKMSKSLGNIITARSFMQTYNPEILKYLMLSVHYRSVSDFSEEAIVQAIRSLARIYSALAVSETYLAGLPAAPVSLAASTGVPGASASGDFASFLTAAWAQIHTAFDDDFNTPQAIAEVFNVIRTWNSQVRPGLKPTAAVLGKAQAFRDFILQVGAPLALFQQPAREFLMKLDDMLLHKMQVPRSQVDKLVQERQSARAAKDFKRSDEVRDLLLKMGIAVMDTPEGTIWEVSK